MLNRSAKLRAMLIADFEDWILGDIARQISALLSEFVTFSILYSRSAGFERDFILTQKENHLAHFLSSSDIADFGPLTYIPCVATLWHMVDWNGFDAKKKRIDGLFVCSEQWRQRAIPHLPRGIPFRRMEYGLDTERFHSDLNAKAGFRKQENLGDRTLILGFAGSILSNEGERKGIDRMWECLLNLKKSSQIPFVLRIAGRGWSPDLIPDDLRKNVIMTLDLPHSMIPSFYASLDYYLCTSRHEGVPYPVLEAMSCESVVISTGVGITPEIIQPGENGFLLRDECFVNDFLEVLTQTAGDPFFRSKIGKSARQSVEKDYSWRSVHTMNYLEMYQEAIGFHQSRPFWQPGRLYLQAQVIGRSRETLRMALAMSRRFGLSWIRLLARSLATLFLKKMT